MVYTEIDSTAGVPTLCERERRGALSYIRGCLTRAHHFAQPTSLSPPHHHHDQRLFLVAFYRREPAQHTITICFHQLLGRRVCRYRYSVTYLSTPFPFSWCNNITLCLDSDFSHRRQRRRRRRCMMIKEQEGKGNVCISTEML